MKSSGRSTGNVQQSDVRTFAGIRPPEYSDQALCQIVVQDAARSDAWISSQQWALSWREAIILYQSPRNISAWENTNTTRASVSRFTVAKHCNSIVPEMVSGMFYQNPPFLLRPRRGVHQDILRAKTEVFSYLMDETSFETELELAIEDMVLLGTMICKYGTSYGVRMNEVVRRKTQPIRYSSHFGHSIIIHTEDSDQYEIEEQEKPFWNFWFERKEIEHILTPPGWRHPDIRKAKYVIEVAFPTFNDLNDLRQDPEYDIPSEQALKDYFWPPKEPAGADTTMGQMHPSTMVQQAQLRSGIQTADPLEQPMKILERTTKDRIVTVLIGGNTDGLIIRNCRNKFREINYLSANYWNVKGSGYGLGLGRIIGQDQRIETGTTNGALDILSFIINQQYVRSRGANVPTQQIRARLGGIIDVDGPVDKALTILETPRVDPALFSMLREAAAQSESASGANEQLVQGQQPQRGRTSLGRTATGATEMASATATRLQGPLGHVIKQVFLPFIRKMDQMVTLEMPLDQIREILDQELGEELIQMMDRAQKDKSDFMDEFMEATLDYEVLAGTYLAARKAMSQALPLIAQIFENPQLLQQLETAGWIVDVKELFAMFMEVSGWKNQRTLIRRMTKDEEQRVASMNQGLQKMQANMAMEEQKFRNNQQLEDQRTIGRAADGVLRQVWKSAAEGENSPLQEGE